MTPERFAKLKAVAAGFVAAESADDDDDGPCVSFSNCQQP